MPKSDFNNLLFDAILTLKTREEIAAFFSDACTLWKKALTRSSSAR